MTIEQKQILMQQFFSDNGARVHGRYTDDFTKTTTYKRKKNKIPLSYTAGMDVDGNDIDIVPMRAGKELQFEINEVAIETKAGLQLILSTDHF